jgi:hypothetical protein
VVPERPSGREPRMTKLWFESRSLHQKQGSGSFCQDRLALGFMKSTFYPYIITFQDYFFQYFIDLAGVLKLMWKIEYVN